MLLNQIINLKLFKFGLTGIFNTFFFLIFLIETLSINNFIAPLINIFVFFFLRFFLYDNFFFK